ncbi:four-carbon acid sugar kinase family protein [Petroclostridium sp. X23]|uniref:four-carbon acid sugar kinase family protein n=1 Tax=Petroclostridium sp. X23 TaxID=3045146 RepID=UPI0024ADE4DA|nr:four-carbon acid sugar kinase family protein [Petroclostridium sp. X23]WHH61567.1 four-carbon acid sugar kinase family protein [Petroclostridium sp. X23]
MPEYVVIADDLTGGNGTGVLLEKLKLKTASLMNTEKVNLDILTQFDAIVYPTDSRAQKEEIAYHRVFSAVSLFKSFPVKLFNKRIDSTCRGNLGTEIDAMLDALGEDRIAIVTPSFPQAGRTVVGGYLLVNGMMLQNTDAARDPLNPISTSVVETLVRKQSKYIVKSIYLDTIYQGSEALKKEILKCVKEGARILIFDALHADDLDTIAEAAQRSGIPYITADPGPLTEAAAKIILTSKQSLRNKKILMSIGSVTNLSKIQIDEVFKTYSGFKFYINTDKLLLLDEQKENEISRVVKEVNSHKNKGDVFCVVTNSIYPEFRLDLKSIAKEQNVAEEELSARINQGIAEISYRIIKENPDFQGIFTSGGDVTIAVCKRFHSLGMSLCKEIIPIVAFGKLIGGEFSNLKMVTKGGMIGDKDGMKQCIHYLKEQLSVE